MNFFTKGRWQHKRCPDIEFEIVNITFIGSKYIKAKVLYFYKSEAHPTISNEPIFQSFETVKIPLKDKELWKKII